MKEEGVYRTLDTISHVHLSDFADFVPASWFKVNWTIISFTKCKDIHLHNIKHYTVLPMGEIVAFRETFYEKRPTTWMKINEMVQHFKHTNRVKSFQLPILKQKCTMRSCVLYRLSYYQVLSKWKKLKKYSIRSWGYMNRKQDEIDMELH